MFHGPNTLAKQLADVRLFRGLVAAGLTEVAGAARRLERKGNMTILFSGKANRRHASLSS